MADPKSTDPLTAEVAAFQASITAPTPFQAVCDIIPDAGDKNAIYAGLDMVGEPKAKPLKYGPLQKFIKDFDLRKFGISRNDVVCTAIPNGAAAAVCFWAVSNQCVFAPLNPALTVAEVEFELTDLPCHTMILLEGDTMATVAAIEESCKRHNVNVLKLVRDPDTVGLFTLQGVAKGTASAGAATKQDDLGLVLHTSGTTKKPKIVPLTHGNMGHGIQFVASTLLRQKSDLCMNVMPLFHIHGLIANVGVSLYSGSAFVAATFMGGEDFLSQIARPALKASWYSAVPTMHEAILLEAEKKGKSLDHSLKLMRNCSAALLPPVSKRFLKAFGEDLNQEFTVVPTYAMTESFPICSNPPHLSIKLSTVGPAMGPSIKILDGHPEDKELPHGTEGEVCVSGNCVTAGYLMRDHMSQDPNIEAFSLPSAPMGRMLRTGDKGYIDADGYLQLVGRFKEIINCGGEKVSPLDMEEQLLKVPGVETCVCFANPAELLGEVVGVACVPKAGAEWPTLKALGEGLPGTPNRFKPRVLVIMDGIPKGPTGKPKRIGLAKMLGIPAVNQTDNMTYRITGKGTELGELKSIDEEGKEGVVWQYPLTIMLDMNPDLGGDQRSLHKLVIQDSLCMDYQLTITTIGMENPISIDVCTTQDLVKEAVWDINRKTKDRGLQWKAKIGENGKREDWCGELIVSDTFKTLNHFWDNGCSDTPPGKMMRLLKVLEIGAGVDMGMPPEDPNDPWYTKAKELNLVAKDCVPVPATDLVSNPKCTSPYALATGEYYSAPAPAAEIS